MNVILRIALIIPLMGLLGGCVVPVDHGYYYPATTYYTPYYYTAPYYYSYGSYGYYPAYYGYYRSGPSVVIHTGGRGYHRGHHHY